MALIYLVEMMAALSSRSEAGNAIPPVVIMAEANGVTNLTLGRSQISLWTMTIFLQQPPEINDA